MVLAWRSNVLVKITSSLKAGLVAIFILSLVACSSYQRNYHSRMPDPIYTMAQLSEQQREWYRTPYRIGGNTRSGVDCSGFVMRTFADRFSIQLPRTTTAQSQVGIRVPLEDIQTGDLVFFKTGRGPNGYHVGIYVKNNQFLHASTSGGVIYSSLNNPYWSKAFWQVRRL
ncbi:NlpC/P60 family protein [Gallibacterium sp. AGMB14963]|nr:NlpC/P60 family protein [Gallibacterium sp. AGMB14963]MDA3977447.1 NlpC/P60 family protein [Gallibacterium sp. AGMB14963]